MARRDFLLKVAPHPDDASGGEFMRVEANDQAKSYEAAMLRKIKDAQELEGEAANRLIREAAPPEEARKPASPPGTGRLVDTTA
jgi:hypothetical protein